MPNAARTLGEDIRQDFPVFDRPVYGRPLVYLDTAATAQKPKSVIEAMDSFMRMDYANVHRGLYALSQRSTAAFEAARAKIVRFINAKGDNEVVFTRNATEAVNLVARSWGDTFLNEGDEIILSALEHHANIVPWQMLRERKKITIKVVPVDDEGAFDLEEYKKLLTPKVKLVSVAHMSNALGVINPVKEIVRLAHANGAKILLDGCQAITHMKVDMQELDCDFYVFSGHKLYGPTGIGVLYGKAELLEQMPPMLGGGDMIENVTFEKTTYAKSPRKFEAGTPAITEAVGLGAAIDFLTQIGMDKIAAHEADLLEYAEKKLSEFNSVKLYGRARPKGGIISFTMVGAHPQDIATILDRTGVAIRVGHHCCQPLMERLGVTSTARVSFGVYNSRSDVDALISGLKTVQDLVN